MSANSNIYHLTVPVERAVNATGKDSTTVSLPNEYDHIRGIALFVQDISNQDNFKIELTDGSKTMIKDVSHKIIKSSDSVAPNQKFLTVDYKYEQNQKFYILVNLADGAVTGTALKFDLVFLLQKGGTGNRGTIADNFTPGAESEQVVY